MCSIVEDDFGDDGAVHAMQADGPTLSLAANERCRKCNDEPAVLKLHLKDPQCRQCFLHYVRHKFRASMGSTKIVRRGSNVLVIFTGTRENVTMLDMIQYAVEQESFKKLRIVPVLLIVDDDFVSQRQERRTELLATLRQFKFPAHYTVTGAGRCCEIGNDGPIEGDFQQDAERLVNVLGDIRSATAKQDFLVQMRKDTYKRMAKQLDCKYVFLSDIGIDLAKTLLSNVALGRGCSLALDVAFCDDRDAEVSLIRPLRDLNPDEVMHYLQFTETSDLRYVDPVHHFEHQPSLQNLTAKFVDGLQVNFPSTVSTVYRSGDKLDTGHRVNDLPEAECNDLLQLFDRSLTLTEQAQRCVFCQATLDYHGSKTLFAIEYSRLLSSRVNAACSPEEVMDHSQRMGMDAERAVNGETDDDVRQLKKQLCRGCRNIFMDMQ